MVPYSSTEEEEKEEDSFLNVLFLKMSWATLARLLVPKKIFARQRLRVIDSRCCSRYL